MKTFIFSLTASFLFCTSSFAATSSWNIDPAPSTASFKVRHMMISDVTGNFRGIQGTVIIDDADLKKSKVDVTIAATSVDTGIKKRDDHLRSADFLDVAKHPNLTFVSKQVKDVSENRFTLVGDLTIHGVTKEVDLAVSEL